jgi:hypothetical protein
MILASPSFPLCPVSPDSAKIGGQDTGGVPTSIDRFPAVFPVFQGPFPIPASAQRLRLNRPFIERFPAGMGASPDPLKACR